MSTLFVRRVGGAGGAGSTFLRTPFLYLGKKGHILECLKEEDSFWRAKSQRFVGRADQRPKEGGGSWKTGALPFSPTPLLSVYSCFFNRCFGRPLLPPFHNPSLHDSETPARRERGEVGRRRREMRRLCPLNSVICAFAAREGLAVLRRSREPT